ncbi:MAG TPA: FkbM family methyltransferase [Anaerolineales bacterium]|nr:FkbM family methyltransferase [Anaerolineales bacterium]
MIPNLFHFIFGLKKQSEAFHLAHYLCIESCLQVNQPDAVYFYYYYEPFGKYWELIRPKIIPVRVDLVPFVSRYKYSDLSLRKFRYAHQSDFIRLEKLVEHGGVYADIDTIFINKLPARLFEQSTVLGREPDIIDTKTGQLTPSLCNAFIMAEKQAGFAATWLARMEETFDGSWSNHSTLLPMRLSSEIPDQVHIEPVRSFYLHPPSREGIHNLFTNFVQDTEGVYSFHLWAHLWWSETRIDFSTFHAGLLTEDYIRNKDTTYSLVARQFLPKPKKVNGTGSRRGLQLQKTRPGQPGSVRLQDRIHKLRAYLWILLKIAGFTVLPNAVIPNAEGHLRYAKSQRLYHLTKRRIEASNHIEAAIVAQIAMWDEYGVMNERFAAEDVVLDIGAHIGTFSYLCYMLGSRRIHAFEPEPANYARLESNLGRLKGVHLNEQAVFRSDRQSGETMLHSGPQFENTGGGGILMGGRLFDVDHQRIVDQTLPSPVNVYTIALDDVLSRFETVRLMKIDCEGSEFPILLTSGALQKVQRIIGEYHEVSAENMALVDPAARLAGQDTFFAQALLDRLTEFGFKARLNAAGPHIGKFFAHR